MSGNKMPSEVINEALPLDALERIDNVCTEFEESLKSQKPARIDDLLTGFEGRERAQLLLELLLLEFTYRRASGESISLDEYLSRFPGDQQTVREAIDRPTHASDATMADPQPIQSSVTFPERIQYLGNYEILDEIARGGMGIVFKARQMTLGRIVAVKMMLHGQHSSSEQIARFKREARIAGRLQHPNIVAVHEVGEHEGMPYFSMDYVDGQSLAEIVRDKPLPPRGAAEYVRVAAETVHRTHVERILHRDLKPSNILIDRDDRVRITDFGLAKAFEPGETLTASESTIGSPSYMPPEQAEGNQSLVSVRSDVYSLGAVLYELLTGRPPFAASNAIETMHQVKTQEPVSPRLLNPEVPKDLETICLKCLEKELHKRYATAEELAEDLQRFLNGEPISARPIGRIERTWRLCRKNPWQSLVIGIVLVFFIDVIAVNVIAPMLLGDSIYLTRSKTIETRVWARQWATTLQKGLFLGLAVGAITSKLIYNKLIPVVLVLAASLGMLAMFAAKYQEYQAWRRSKELSDGSFESTENREFNPTDDKSENSTEESEDLETIFRNEARGIRSERDRRIRNTSMEVFDLSSNNRDDALRIPLSELRPNQDVPGPRKNKSTFALVPLTAPRGPERPPLPLRAPRDVLSVPPAKTAAPPAPPATRIIDEP